MTKPKMTPKDVRHSHPAGRHTVVPAGEDLGY